jgi:hypothetical protein
MRNEFWSKRIPRSWLRGFASEYGDVLTLRIEMPCSLLQGVSTPNGAERKLYSRAGWRVKDFVVLRTRPPVKVVPPHHDRQKQ